MSTNNVAAEPSSPPPLPPQKLTEINLSSSETEEMSTTPKVVVEPSSSSETDEMSTIQVKDYRKCFRTLLPIFMHEATHFTLDKYLLRKFFRNLDFVDCNLVFNCQSWNQLRYLTIRQPSGHHFLLELPPHLEELYLCCNRTFFLHVLPPWNRCRRFIHDWEHNPSPISYLTGYIECDEYLMRWATCENLIDLFNLGYAYAGTVTYSPPKRFALFAGPSTSHSRRPRSMEKFVKYSTPLPCLCPQLDYTVCAKNERLIKGCLQQVMASWPQNRDFFHDVCHLIKALVAIEESKCDQIDNMKSEFREIHMSTEEGRMWRDRIGPCLTCYDGTENYNLDYADFSSDSSESDMFKSDDSWDESYKSPMKRIYANDPLPGYEHFASPPPLYAKH